MSGSTPIDVLELTTDPDAVNALLTDLEDHANTRLVRDDFAGPGGWSTGITDLLHDAGLTEVALEWDTAACATRIANGHHRTLRADVAAYPIFPFLGRTVGYIGSPPCQTFSMAGGGSGREHLDLLCECVRGILLGRITYAEAMARLEAAGALDDEDGNVDPRNGLILVPARVIRSLLDHDGLGPHDLEWVCLEQVPPAAPVFRAYAMALRELGFSVVVQVLNAADYGVPQTRERVIVIASRVRTVMVPEPTHVKGGEPEDLFGGARLGWVSMARALGWGMNARPYVTVAGGRPDAGGPDPMAVGGSGGRATIAKEEGEGRWTPPGGALVMGRRPNAAIRAIDEPAPTITGGNDTPHWHESAEEAARFLLDRRTNSKAPGWRANIAEDGSVPMVPTVKVDVGVRPAPTLTSKAGGQWVVSDALLEDRRAGAEEFDPHWVEDRPATVVASREIVQHPGATKNRFNDSTKTRNDGLRITEAEGAVLQGFPPSYDWQGKTKGKRWEQIGNVVCPPVARRVVGVVLGVDPVPLPWHEYAFTP